MNPRNLQLLKIYPQNWKFMLQIIQKMAFKGGLRPQKVAYMPLYTKIASTPPLPRLVTSRINA